MRFSVDNAMHFGLLNINKPGGITSRQVVDHVAKLVKPDKTGHSGTLDPLATGVLVVCIGRATRLTPYIQDQLKAYVAQFLLGRRSNTNDVTGDVVEVAQRLPVTRHMIEELIPRFVGRINQVPPQFSAVHVDGQRAYKLARHGEQVQLRPKMVEIHRIVLKKFNYPEIELEIECGSGTYIRSIGRDLGELLGCGAVMSELMRSRIGPFTLDTAVELSDLNEESLTSQLLPTVMAVDHFRKQICTENELNAVRCGRPIAFQQPSVDDWRKAKPEMTAGEQPMDHEGLVALLTCDGQLAALAQIQNHGRILAPKQVFVC